MNVVYGVDRSKLGVAKELEDVPDFGRSTRTDKSLHFNKYETVNPKNLSSLGGSGLTRSQSHVWTPERVQLTDRIFSNDNLLKSQTEQEQKHTYHFPKFETKAEDPYKIEKPLTLPPKSSPRIHAQDVSFSNGGMPLSPLLGNPIVRRRMPKTNAYTNYPLERFSPSSTPAAQHCDEPSSSSSPKRSKDMRNPVPKLKNNSNSNGHYSRGNSSDSSNSLPSTPTQSIDVLYSQLNRSNYVKNSSSPLQKSLYSTHPAPTPKSILKGSLSSTPSESDERLDSSRSGPGPISMNNTSVTTISNGGKATGRLTNVGVRERRNSFRQAVWKEAQNEQQYQQQTPLASNYLSASALCQNNVGLPNSDTNEKLGLRTHKDYEPIWPDGNSSNHTFRVTSTLIGQESRSSPPVGTSMGHNSKVPISHTYSNVGGDESKITSTTTTPYQSRVEDIKVLLEELRAPMGVALSSNSNAGSTDLSKSKSNNLKYQRSLKAPSRSQYQDQSEVGAMSCFTFRKPSSLESITDQVQVEVDEEYRSLLTPKALLPKADGFKNTSIATIGPGRSRSRGPHSDRLANDYVTLTQCRTNPLASFDGESDGRRNDQYNNYQDPSNLTPIPPPRTKAKKSHYYKVVSEMTGCDTPDSGPGREYLGERSVEPTTSASSTGSSGRAPLSVWMTESPRTKLEITSEDVPDGKLRTQNQNQYKDESMSGAGGTSTSPKALTRAFGLFQAKAANVRSKFANWTENSRDRSTPSNSGGSSTSQSKRGTGHSNGTAPGIRDQSYKSHPQGDNGKSSVKSYLLRINLQPGCIFFLLFTFVFWFFRV